MTGIPGTPDTWIEPTSPVSEFAEKFSTRNVPSLCAGETVRTGIASKAHGYTISRMALPSGESVPVTYPACNCGQERGASFALDVAQLETISRDKKRVVSLRNMEILLLELR